MSIKIHDGFCFGTDNFRVIRELVMDFGKEIKPIGDAALLRWIARQAVSLVDCRAMGRLAGWLEIKEKERGHNALYAAYATVLVRLRNVREHCVRDVLDWGFSVIVFPIKGRTLGVPLSGQRVLLELWAGKSFVTPWVYWTNTDKPNEFTDEQWAARGQEWEEAMPGWCAMNKGGFEIVARDSYMDVPIGTWEKIVPYIETKEARVGIWVGSMLFEEWSKTRPDVKPGDVQKAMDEFVAWRDGPDGQKRMAELTVEIGSRLPEIMLEVLTTE